MTRTLLATTALVALLSSAAVAQTTADPAAKPAVPPAAQGSVGYLAAAPDQVLASGVLGRTVYTGADEEGEAVGDVNDVVINAAGGAEALVIGVGGFLGLGEKDVAVNFDRISWSDRNGEKIIVISATKEELQAAPEFKRSAVMDSQVSTDNDGQALNQPAATAPVAVPDAGTTEETVAAAGQPATEQPAADQTASSQPATGTTPEMTDPDNPAAVQVDPGTTASATPRQELQVVDPSLLSAAKLIGTPVKVADDSQVGKIGDVILSRDGKVEAYIIDVGGFLGIGQKQVAMNARSVEVMADTGGAMTIYSPFTKDQLEQQAAYDPQAYQSNRDGVTMGAPRN